MKKELKFDKSLKIKQLFLSEKACIQEKQINFVNIFTLFTEFYIFFGSCNEIETVRTIKQ